MSDYRLDPQTGVIVPDTAELQSAVEAEWRNAFGEDLRTTPDTPQGVLITAETLARRTVAENNAQLANQINPDLAGGVFLDALAALMGLERRAASFTRVDGVVLVGRPNTLIPEGVRARSAAGDLFRTAGTVQLDSTGGATVTMLAVETGPVPAAAGSITTIVDPVLGWEGVTNPYDGVPGEAEQSDGDLRDLRRRTLALQGISTPEAVISAVSALPNVRSLQFRENVTDVTATIDGVTLGPHSVWVAVDGGLDSDVAMALLENKTAGAGWNGDTVVTVTEPHSGQDYQVRFDRPAEIQVLVRVTVRQGSSVVDPQTAVPQAVVDYAEGRIDGERGFVVGAAVSPFELAGAVNRQFPGLFVTRVEVARASDGIYQDSELPITPKQVARTVASSVIVVQVP